MWRRDSPLNFYRVYNSGKNITVIYLRQSNEYIMRSLVFVFILFTLACSTTKDISDLGPDDVLISMEKEACFGTCPAYSFKIYEGGYCSFEGKQNSYKMGTHSLTLSKEKYKEVKKAFETVDFFQYQDFYESNIPDLPTVKISYRKKNQVKSVTGKRERPDAVHKLQFILEEIAESKTGWKVIDGSIQEKTTEYDKSQIVVQLIDGAQLSRWFDYARKNYGIRILKQIDGSYDHWLVSYNMKDYTPEEILNVLRKDENVASAEFRLINP